MKLSTKLRPVFNESPEWQDFVSREPITKYNKRLTTTAVGIPKSKSEIDFYMHSLSCKKKKLNLELEEEIESGLKRQESEKIIDNFYYIDELNENLTTENDCEMTNNISVIMKNSDEQVELLKRANIQIIKFKPIESMDRYTSFISTKDQYEVRNLLNLKDLNLSRDKIMSKTSLVSSKDWRDKKKTINNNRTIPTEILDEISPTKVKKGWSPSKNKFKFHGQLYTHQETINRVKTRIMQKSSEIKQFNQYYLKEKYKKVKNVKIERDQFNQLSYTENKKNNKINNLFTQIKENRKNLVTKKDFAIDDKHYEKFLPKVEMKSLRYVTSI